MFTLVYINGSLNRPDTLTSFLQSNVGKSAMLQIDCVSPYRGTEQDLIKEVCVHLNTIDPKIMVEYDSTQNITSESVNNKRTVHFLVMQILSTNKN